MPLTFDGTPAQVDGMMAAWRAAGGCLSDLTADAFGSLSGRQDLAVMVVPEFVPPDSQLGCSVAGGYRWDPPTLIVTQSMSRRRQQFTLLHELGHHIQKNNLALGTAVVEHRQPEAFEDAACDAFAARVLLPDDLVHEHSTVRGPTVQTALDLFTTSNASRAAICVRLAGQLQSSGVVAVLDEGGAVTFAAARGGLFPPARGSTQGANPLVAAAMSSLDKTRLFTRDDAVIWYRDGHSSERLYGQAAWAGDRLFVMMVEFAAPWLSFSPPREGTGQQTALRWEQCEHCGRTFRIGTTCTLCGQPRCPAGHCGCTSRNFLTCTDCHLEKHRSQFTPGSTICTDCAD